MNDTTWFWQIVDAHGLADVSSDEVVALRELIGASERSAAELDAVSAAIGSPRFMDPPDGGSVSLAEQVKRMRGTLEASERLLGSALSTMLEQRDRMLTYGKRTSELDHAIEQTHSFLKTGRVSDV